MALVKEYQNDFRKYVTTRTTAHPGIDLTVTILTTGIWPSYKTSALNLPTEMVTLLVFQVLEQKSKDVTAPDLFVSGQVS